MVPPSLNAPEVFLIIFMSGAGVEHYGLSNPTFFLLMCVSVDKNVIYLTSNRCIFEHHACTMINSTPQTINHAIKEITLKLPSYLNKFF
jgi:hypothetical protein